MGLYFGATSGDVFGSGDAGQDVVHGGDEPAAGALRPRGLRVAGRSTARQGLRIAYASVEPADSIRVGVIRTRHALLARLVRLVDVAARVLLRQPVDLRVAPSSTSVAVPVDLDPAVRVAGIDDDERDARVGARGTAASRAARPC